MSAETVNPQPLINTAPNASISSVAVAVGLFSTTLFGALQAIVLVAIIGNGYKTDAFLAAYSLYYAFVIVAASVRGPFVTALGAMDDDGLLKRSGVDLVSRAMMLSIAVGLVLWLVSPFAGALIAHGHGHRAQVIAIVSLVILIPGGMMQLYATSAAAVLNSARRFVFSAAVYACSSLIAIVASAILLATIGIYGAPIGMLFGAVCLAVGHRFYVARFDVIAQLRPTLLREARTRKLSTEILSNASLGLAIQLGLTVALAAVGRIGRVGLVTDYSYGYFIVLATTGFSTIALNTVILPDVVSEATARGIAGARDRIVAVAPFSFAAVVPVIAALLTFGRPFLDWIAAPLLEPADIAIVYEVAAIFSLAAIGTVLLQNGSTAVVSMGRWRLLGTAAALTLLAQGAAVWVASGIGLTAIAWAQSAIIAVAALLLLAALFRAEAPAVILGSLRPLLWLTPCTIGFIVSRLALGANPSVAATLGALIASTALYVLLALVALPEIRTAVSALAQRTA